MPCPHWALLMIKRKVLNLHLLWPLYLRVWLDAWVVFERWVAACTAIIAFQVYSRHTAALFDLLSLDMTWNASCRWVPFLLLRRSLHHLDRRLIVKIFCCSGRSVPFGVLEHDQARNEEGEQDKGTDCNHDKLGRRAGTLILLFFFFLYAVMMLLSECDFMWETQNRKCLLQGRLL